MPNKLGQNMFLVEIGVLSEFLINLGARAPFKNSNLAYKLEFGVTYITDPGQCPAVTHDTFTL